VVGLGQGRADAARFYLGQIAESANKTDEALRWYREVTDDEQRMPALMRAVQLLSKLDRTEDVREWLQNARRQHPADKIRLFLLESQLLRDRGAHAEVQKLLEDGLKAHPDDPDLLYEAGLAAERLGQVELLEKRFRRLSEIKPDSPQGYNALGYSLADRGIRLDEAERLIDKALALAPDDYYILDSKGWVLFRQGKLDAALTYLRKAYALKPEPEIAAHIGEVLWTQGKHDEARAIWSEAEKASPGNSELLATIKRFLP
jgi:Flp pilus assembly protein TadD